MTPESKVKTKFKTWLNKNEDFHGILISVQTHGFGASGHADYTLFQDGVYYSIEIKASYKQKINALQEYRLNEVIKNQGHAIILNADNFKLATKWLSNALKDSKTQQTGDIMDFKDEYENIKN